MRAASSVVRRVMGRGLLGIVALALLPYAWGPMYTFPGAAPFSGNRLWNPYASLSGTWQRANLHAHGHAWGGLTSGEQSDAAVAARYRGLGYSVPGVSDYQHIATFDGVDSLALYEHGFNLGKNHQLAIGARRVDWFDFPLWQTVSNQQYVIDRLKAASALVALNHPSSRDAYDLATMRALTGYDLVEIVNGPFTAEDVWDAALSAGRPVWAVANDDTHDLRDARRTAAGWNMIDATSAASPAVIDALKAGRSYAVLRTGALEAASITTLSGVIAENGVVSVAIEGAPSTFTFIGQDGAVRHTVKDARSAAYTLTPADTYVRTVVTSPQTTLYLNPVIRWNGTNLPSPTAAVNEATTWTQRGAIVILMVLLALRAKSLNR